MPVTYLIRFDVDPDQRERFLALLTGVLDAMRAEPTFREAVLHRDPQAEHRFMLYETWESHDDVVAVQLHRPDRRAWHDALPEILRAPRDVTVWRPNHRFTWRLCRPFTKHHPEHSLQPLNGIDGRPVAPAFYARESTRRDHRCPLR